MNQEDTKEFTMAVGTSVLDSTIMEGDGFYTTMENVPEQASHSTWSGVKNSTGQLCRICANTNDYLIPIYEGEGAEHQLELKIQKHLPIQVTSTDTLPLQLCYQCASTLIAWDTMIVNCLEADKKLRAMQEVGEENEEDDNCQQTDVMDHHSDAADSDDEPLMTSKIKLNEKSKAPLKKKILSKAKSKPQSSKTAKPSTVTKDIDDKERLTTTHNTLYTREVVVKLEDDDVDDVVKQGENKFKMKEDLLRWMFICHVCGKGFKKKGALVRHERNVHERRRDWLCDICGKGFPERAVRDDHRRIHTGECPYVCHTCGKTFKTMASLCIHSKVHVDEFPHHCPYCSGKFRWKTQLNGHLTTHTGEKKHKCDVCGKAFGVKCDLNRHKHVHSDEKPFTCSLCGCNFAQKRYLKKHEKARHRNFINVVCSNETTY